VQAMDWGAEGRTGGSDCSYSPYLGQGEARADRQGEGYFRELSAHTERPGPFIAISL
jgi:hypothetical protein